MLTTALEVRIAEVLGSDVRDARLIAKGMLAARLQKCNSYFVIDVYLLFR